MQKKKLCITFTAVVVVALVYKRALSDQQPKATVSFSAVAACSRHGEKSPATPNTLVIHNAITKEMVSYTKYFTSYTPEFELFVEGTPLKPGESVSIAAKKEITCAYTYNFLNGFKKGRKEVVCAIPTNKTNLDVTFSWHNQKRISIQAT